MIVKPARFLGQKSTFRSARRLRRPDLVASVLSAVTKARLDPTKTYVVAAGLTALGAVVWIAFGHNPLITTPALPLRSGALLVVLSLGLGVALAGISIGLTRSLAQRASWARDLAGSLRPRLSGTSTLELLKTAVLVGVTEEIFFRGILQPLVGLWVSSLVFGLVHAGAGKSRFFYVVWAGCTGLAFGTIFWLTGSICGAILAHVLINGANALYLRDMGAATPRRRALGGLLSR
jgi:hypothetical protein